MNKDKLILFYVYDDDTPYIVRNPPRNFKNLLKRWNKLDKEFVESQGTYKGNPPNWSPVNVWLKKQGVDIVAPDSVYLDDYLP